LEAFLQYLFPELEKREPSERAMAGLIHIADGIQCLRWLRDAHTAKKKSK
jgi:hypothetical protein